MNNTMKCTLLLFMILMMGSFTLSAQKGKAMKDLDLNPALKKKLITTPVAKLKGKDVTRAVVNSRLGKVMPDGSPMKKVYIHVAESNDKYIFLACEFTIKRETRRLFIPVEQRDDLIFIDLRSRVTPGECYGECHSCGVDMTGSGMTYCGCESTGNGCEDADVSYPTDEVLKVLMN